MAAILVMPLCGFTKTYPTSETTVEVKHLLSQRATPGGVYRYRVSFSLEVIQNLKSFIFEGWVKVVQRLTLLPRHKSPECISVSIRYCDNTAKSAET